MENNKDIALIGEYEELLVILRQLHKDTPILEKQHQSIREAFVSAQSKLESTIASSEAEMKKSKEKILGDFESQCRKIVESIMEDAQLQATETLRKIQTEKKSVEQLLAKLESVKIQVENQSVESKKTTIARKEDALIHGERFTGEMLQQKFANHIGKDLIVKRVKNGEPWTNDYCMFVTKITQAYVYGDVYLDGKIHDGKINKPFPKKDTYMIFKSPSEATILTNK